MGNFSAFFAKIAGVTANKTSQPRFFTCHCQDLRSQNPVAAQYFPDKNLIEHVWADLKNLLRN